MEAKSEESREESASKEDVEIKVRKNPQDVIVLKSPKEDDSYFPGDEDY